MPFLRQTKAQKEAKRIKDLEKANKKRGAKKTMTNKKPARVIDASKPPKKRKKK